MLPIFHFSIERWRKNKEYGVWVSTIGRIRLIKNKEFLNPRIDKKGYSVVFTEKGPITVHRLVAYTWLGGSRNEKYNIDHIDSNKRNNAVSNLRWVEKQINTEYAKFTFTDSKSEYDEVESIENTENKINVIEFSSAKTAAKMLEELYDEKKIHLFANNKCMPEEYILIQKEAKISTMPKRENFFLNLIRAMRTNSNYCGYKWHYEEVENEYNR